LDISKSAIDLLERVEPNGIITWEEFSKITGLLIDGVPEPGSVEEKHWISRRSVVKDLVNAEILDKVNKPCRFHIKEWNKSLELLCGSKCWKRHETEFANKTKSCYKRGITMAQQISGNFLPGSADRIAADAATFLIETAYKMTRELFAKLGETPKDEDSEQPSD